MYNYLAGKRGLGWAGSLALVRQTGGRAGWAARAGRETGWACSTVGTGQGLVASKVGVQERAGIIQRRYIRLAYDLGIGAHES